MGARARARLVVLGVEVGGRWSDETQRFVSLLARAKGARSGCCDEGLNRLGTFVGALFFPALWLVQWRIPSCNFLVLQGLMGTRHLFTRWTARLPTFCEKVVCEQIGGLTSSDVLSSSFFKK